MRSLRVFLQPLLCLAAFAALAGGADAQVLNAGMCPAGASFRLTTGFTTFPVGGGGGIPMLRHTLSDPAAVCNDGSPALMYIRPADAAYGGNMKPASSKWLIFLDGGGGCHDEDDCLETRWCGFGGQVFDRAGKMSSLGAAQAIFAPGGIWTLAPAGGVVNHFADYNQVLVHYCSSDNWIGSAAKNLTATNGTSYDITFAGEAIVNAVFNQLRAGGTAGDPGAQMAFYATALPDLDNASEIILAGESAGGGGLRHHLDRLREDVIEPNATNPNVVVRGLIDAGMAPHLGGATIQWGGVGAPLSYADYLLNQNEPIVRAFWEADDSALDQSCLDTAWAPWHNLAGGHPQVCGDNTYILLNHITTPVFVRQDINDPLAKQKYVTWTLFPTTDDYWLAQFNQLTLHGAYTPALGGLEPPLAAPGVQGIHCMRHVSVQHGAGFFRHTVVNPAVVGLSFHDLLVNWLNGLSGTNTVQIQTDNPAVVGYTPSFCP